MKKNNVVRASAKVAAPRVPDFEDCVPPRRLAASPPLEPDNFGDDARSGGGEYVASPEASVEKLIDRGHEIILQLMVELRTVNRNIELIEELIGEALDGEKNKAKILQMLANILSMKDRSITAKNLATALTALKAVAPGKKEQAEAASKTAAKGTDWEDDLDEAPAARPN